MQIVPVKFREAKAFIAEHHRHSKPPQGHLFSVGLRSDGGLLVAVATVGRPVARMLDDGLTVEITRCCTQGSVNACSMLYGAAKRAAKAIGYRKAITYTQAEEPGTSLKASGFTKACDTSGGEWSRGSRQRSLVENSGAKSRWEVNL